MASEIVTVSVGGKRRSDIEEIEVDAAFNNAVRTFRIDLASAASAARIFGPGIKIEIFFNTDLVCRGYVDRLEQDFKRLIVSGRSLAQDFVDCSAMDSSGTGTFTNQTLLDIAQSLDEFGVGISSDQPLVPIDNYQITPGETAFNAVEKLAREQGFTLAGQPDGSIKITKPGSSRHSGGLIQGINLKSLSSDLNWAHRYSKVIVRGQAAEGTDDSDLKIEATATDNVLKRNRPLIHVEDRDLDQKSAQALAIVRAQRIVGESLKANAVVQGFRDNADVVWTPGKLVWVESEKLGLAQALLIKHALFAKRRKGGSTTRLGLVDPQAFGGTQAKGSKVGAAWATDAPAFPYQKSRAESA